MDFHALSLRETAHKRQNAVKSLGIYEIPTQAHLNNLSFTFSHTSLSNLFHTTTITLVCDGRHLCLSLSLSHSLSLTLSLSLTQGHRGSEWCINNGGHFIKNGSTRGMKGKTQKVPEELPFENRYMFIQRAVTRSHRGLRYIKYSTTL